MSEILPPPRDAFVKRQSQLRTVVENNDSFIRDTDIKIDRAEKKAREEQNACRTTSLLNEGFLSVAVRLDFDFWPLFLYACGLLGDSESRRNLMQRSWPMRGQWSVSPASLL